MKFHSVLIALAAVVLSLSRAALALSPDELVLICNANVPASVSTAEFYVKARQIPDGRIIKLNLPSAEEIPFDRYENEVVPQVRGFLRDNGLQQKVKCAVTFFGVPFRIGSKQLSPAENEEVAQLKKELDATAARALPLVVEVEKLAGELDPSFTPRIGQDPADLPERANQGLVTVAKHLPRDDNPQHKDLLPRLVKLTQEFGGDAQIAEKLSDAEIASMLPPDQAKRWPARRAEIQAVNHEVEKLHDQRGDPAARKRVREIIQKDFGLFGYLGVLQAHIEYLSTDGTVSALDNELALIWWPYYNRAKWQPNPLNVRFGGSHPPVIMVTRLDGPQEGTATQIILGSLKAERDGLQGRVVIDSTGGRAPDGSVDREGGYRNFDQKLLNLAELIKSGTKLPLTLDRRPAVLPPGSVKDVAIYCGWYSVRNYVPSCTFVAGAVGYHVASFEMISLRSDNEKGWVAGLLNDGVASTIGSVAEPYLSAMPAPDEFFPLLLTGKLTLAECYWKTVPMTSWMMTCIGDPLYTPFKKDPALRPEQLPELLRRAMPDESRPAPGGSVETPPPAL